MDALGEITPEFASQISWQYGSPSLQYYAEMGYENAGPFVYFIQSGDFVKVGWSKQPELRVDQIRRGGRALRPTGGLPEDPKLLAYYPGTMSDEADLHRQFQSTHDQGEWFTMSPELEAHIEWAKKAQASIEVDVHLHTHAEKVEKYGWPPVTRTRDDLISEQISRNAGEYDMFAAIA